MDFQAQVSQEVIEAGLVDRRVLRIVMRRPPVPKSPYPASCVVPSRRSAAVPEAREASCDCFTHLRVASALRILSANMICELLKPAFATILIVRMTVTRRPRALTWLELLRITALTTLMPPTLTAI